MAKSYPTINTFNARDSLTLNVANDIGTNINNNRVPPMCRVFMASNQAISSGTLTDVVWTNQDFDTEEPSENMWTSGASVTIRTAGIYLLATTIWFTVNNTGQRQLSITKNASANAETPRVAQAFLVATTTAVNNPLSVSTVASLAVGDVIKVNVWANTTGINVLGATDTPSHLSVTWLGQVS